MAVTKKPVGFFFDAYGNGHDADFEVHHNLDCPSPVVTMYMVDGEELTMVKTPFHVIDKDKIKVHGGKAVRPGGLVVGLVG